MECSEDRVCISKSNCSYWLEREERYKEGRDDTFISEAREQICNRQQQALCCPKSGESLINESYHLTYDFYCEGVDSTTVKPIDGGWSEWEDREECTKVCRENGGVRIRQRSCSNPAPQYGGKECEGEALVAYQCKEFPCK